MPEPMSGGAITCVYCVLVLTHIFFVCVAAIAGQREGRKEVEDKAIAAGLSRVEYDPYLDQHVAVFKTREELLREWKEKDDGY